MNKYTSRDKSQNIVSNLSDISDLWVSVGLHLGFRVLCKSVQVMGRGVRTPTFLLHCIYHYFYCCLLPTNKARILCLDSL